ncbi:hypothetical protein [Klebsiella quasipneumoniae]
MQLCALRYPGRALTW